MKRRTKDFLTVYRGPLRTLATPRYPVQYLLGQKKERTVLHLSPTPIQFSYILSTSDCALSKKLGAYGIIAALRIRKNAQEAPKYGSKYV